MPKKNRSQSAGSCTREGPMSSTLSSAPPPAMTAPHSPREVFRMSRHAARNMRSAAVSLGGTLSPHASRGRSTASPAVGSGEATTSAQPVTRFIARNFNAFATTAAGGGE